MCYTRERKDELETFCAISRNGRPASGFLLMMQGMPSEGKRKENRKKEKVSTVERTGPRGEWGDYLAIAVLGERRMLKGVPL